MASPNHTKRFYFTLFFIYLSSFFFGEVGGGWGLLIKLLKIENKTITLKIKIYKKV